MEVDRVNSSFRPRWMAWLAVMFGMCPAIGLAQEGYGLTQDGYALGAGILGRASLEATAIQAENFFYDDQTRVSATGYQLKPDVSISRAGSISQIDLSGSLAQTRYDVPGELDESLDYSVEGNLRLQPLTRHRFDLAGKHTHGHDDAGLQRTTSSVSFTSGVLDEWDQEDASLTYRFGAAEAVGSNTLRAAYVQRAYTTNRNSTRPLDFTGRELGYELAYEYSPKTAVVALAKYRETDFAQPVVNGLGNRNGNELTLRAGLRWFATAKTSGDVQLGVREYSIDSRSQRSIQTLSWQGDVSWKPTRASRFRLSTGRSTIETYFNQAYFVDERRVDLSWSQDWTSRFNTELLFNYSQNDFIGFDYEEERVVGRVAVQYLLLGGLRSFASYDIARREASAPGLDYDAPIFRAGLRWSL